MRSASPLLLLALVLGACSVKSAADDDEVTTTSPGSGSEDTGGPVLDLLDDGQCEVWLQDCPEDHKCVPYASNGGSWDAFECVPILGQGKLGQACTWAGKAEATDDCGPGLVCWETSESDGELVGKCAGLCTGDANDPQCGVGKSCVIAAENHAPAVCGTDCNVLLQDCEAPSACTFAAGEFTCMANQGLELGEPCEHFDDCQAGTVCVPGERLPSCAGSSCCAGYCDLLEPACATVGTECVAFFEESVHPGLFTDGVCLVPDN